MSKLDVLISATQRTNLLLEKLLVREAPPPNKPTQEEIARELATFQAAQTKTKGKS